VRLALLLAALGLAVNVWSFVRSPPLPAKARRCVHRAVPSRPHVHVPHRERR